MSTLRVHNFNTIPFKRRTERSYQSKLLDGARWGILPFPDVPPHDEYDAGPDERVLDDEGVEEGRALVQGVPQDVPVEGLALLQQLLLDPHPLADDVALAVVVASGQLVKGSKGNCYCKMITSVIEDKTKQRNEFGLGKHSLS